MTTNDIARKIRALLDKAEASEFAFERDAFTAKAMSMMASHQITEAMVDAAGNVENRRGKLIERTISLGSGPYVRARLRLLTTVASSNCCHVLTYVGWEGRNAVVSGFESDADRTEMLYTSLLVQAVDEANRIEIPAGLKTVSVRRSFLFGFSAKVGERLDEARSVATADFEAEHSDESTSVALVLADRESQVNDFVQRRHGKLRTLRRSAAVGGSGYADGVAAGARADIGSGRVSGNRGEIAS